MDKLTTIFKRHSASRTPAAGPRCSPNFLKLKTSTLLICLSSADGIVKMSQTATQRLVMPDAPLHEVMLNLLAATSVNIALFRQLQPPHTTIIGIFRFQEEKYLLR